MSDTDIFYNKLAEQISLWAKALGFQAVGITDVDLSNEEKQLEDWLAKGFHGSMSWMAAHDKKRSRPDELVPGTKRIISVRMDYLPGDTEQIKVLKDSNKAYIARYALGRDYHKLIRKRLAKLSNQILDAVNQQEDDYAPRAFVDSAPVMERALAEKAGLGWVGKNTLVLHEHAGSWFFLGEIFTNLPLPINQKKITNRCDDCTACLQVCPTDAFPKAYVMDARRCISYLTIENKDIIPEEFRDPMGNRVFGCDDCQAICPWNKFAKPTQETDFLPRHNLDAPDLLELFHWSEDEYLKKTEGSPLRRIGYQNWLRNLAVGLGNAEKSTTIVEALEAKRPSTSELVQEHIDWAITQQNDPKRRRKRKIKATK